MKIRHWEIFIRYLIAYEEVVKSHDAKCRQHSGMEYQKAFVGY